MDDVDGVAVQPRRPVASPQSLDEPVGPQVLVQIGAQESLP